MPRRAAPGGTVSIGSCHTRIGRAFDSVMTSRQFSGRSSSTTSMCSAAAALPRDPRRTNTEGSSKPWATSHRCVWSCVVSPGRVGPLRQENHFQPVRRSQRGDARDRSRLDLLQRRPEVLDGGDVLPELAQLAVGERSFSRRMIDFRRAFAARGASSSLVDQGFRCVLPTGRNDTSGPNNCSASRWRAPSMSAIVPSRSHATLSGICSLLSPLFPTTPTFFLFFPVPPPAIFSKHANGAGCDFEAPLAVNMEMPPGVWRLLGLACTLLALFLVN